MSTNNIVSAINLAMKTALNKDDRVVVYGEDVGLNGGVFQATAGLQKEFGEKRCFDSPLAESGIIGTAVGMAIAGLKPVVEIQFSGFVWPGLNQIVSHVARIRNRTRSSITLPMVIRMPYGGNVKALEHHSESFEAVFGHIPGLKVVIPSTPHDAKGLLLSAIEDPDPVLFMEPKRVYHSPQQEIPDVDYDIPLGKALIVEAGSAVTLVAYGASMKEARAASTYLRSKDIEVELVDLRTIYPYDAEAILNSVKKTKRLLVVHEGPRSFGVAAEIIALVTEELFMDLDAPPSRLTGSDIIIPLPGSEHYYYVQTEQIVDEIMRIVQF